MNHWLLAGSLVFLAWSSATSVFRTSDRLDRWFLASAGTVLTLAFVSLALVRLGVYSLPAASGSCLAFGAALQLAVRRHSTDRGETPSEPGGSVQDIVPLLVVLALFALYESYPTYSLLGGRDPGLYATFAVHIANTGGLDLDLPVLSRVHEKLGEQAFLWYPGIYSEFARHVSDDPSDLVPQFMHLFPALAANGFAAFGFEGLVRVNALVFALGIWAFFMVTRRLLPLWWALAASVAFGINTAVIWSARTTMTEPLTVLLLFFATYIVFLANDRKSTPIALVGGLLLGAAILCRVDACFAVLVVIGNAMASLTQDEGARRRAWWIAGAYLVASSIGWLDGYVHSHPYFNDLWLLGSLDKLLLFSYGVGAIALGLAWLPNSWLAERDRVQNGLTNLVGLGVGVLVVWVGYAILVRAPAAQDFAGRAIVELAWYVTPLGCVLTCAGMAAVVWNRLWDRWLALLFLGAGTLFVFTYNPAISPDHIWATRRWVPQVIPSISLFSVAALWFLTEAVTGWRRWLAFGVSAAMAAMYAATTWRIASVFLFESMFKGITRDYEELAETVERTNQGRVVLTDTWDVASILTYAYGIPTVMLKAPLDKENAAALSGFTYVSRGQREVWAGPVDRVWLGGRFLEIREGGRPRHLTQRIHDLRVGIVASVEGSGGSPFPRVFRGYELPTKGGLTNKKRGTVRLQGDGALQSGPHIDLDAGSYEAKWYGRVLEDGAARVDVTTEDGTREHAHLEVSLTSGLRLRYFASVPFTLEEGVEGAEFRLALGDGAEVALKRLEVHVAPEPDGDDPEPSEGVH